MEEERTWPSIGLRQWSRSIGNDRAHAEALVGGECTDEARKGLGLREHTRWGWRRMNGQPGGERGERRG